MESENVISIGKTYEILKNNVLNFIPLAKAINSNNPFSNKELTTHMKNLYYICKLITNNVSVLQSFFEDGYTIDDLQNLFKIIRSKLNSRKYTLTKQNWIELSETEKELNSLYNDLINLEKERINEININNNY